MHTDKRRYKHHTAGHRRVSALIGGYILLLMLLAFAPPPTGMYVFDPPLPIVLPLDVQTTGGATTQIYVRADGDVSSINVRAPRHCYTVQVADATGQQITIGDRSACGLTLWLPLVNTLQKDVP